MVRLAIQLRFEVIEETPVTPVFAFISVVRHLSQMFPVFVCVCVRLGKKLQMSVSCSTKRTQKMISKKLQKRQDSDVGFPFEEL